MKFLLDTHLLVRTAVEPEKLSVSALALMEDPENDLYFSVVSLWEVSIKRRLKRPDFSAEPRLLHRELLDNGYLELGITSRHALGIDGLPWLHKDPFDRMMVAQALAEGITLLTVDRTLAEYPCPVRLV